MNQNRLPGFAYESLERLNYTSNKRNLMNPDKLLRLQHKNAILLLRGQKPYMINKLDYTKLEAEKYIVTSSISSYIPKWKNIYK